MNILICPDKFKDSLKAFEVAKALKEGIQTILPNSRIHCLPLADGGEGTLEALESIFEVQKIRLTVRNPLFKSIKANYLYDETNQIAYIEMAQASGIELLKIEERNPLETSTFGTGELILHAIQHGAKKIYLFVGGSATNEGGMGMASALGYEFLDEFGHPLEGKGKNLTLIHQVLEPQTTLLKKIKEIAFLVATDVANPLLGPSGASEVFGPQKGANEEIVKYLDNGLNNLHNRCVEDLQSDTNIVHQAGSGAAGGLGAGAQYFLGAQLISGADFLLENYQFDQLIKDYDVIITGEGKIDEQTWEGKLISKVLEASSGKNIQLVCGICDTETKYPTYEIIKKASNQEDALKNAAYYLEKIGTIIARTILASDKK